MPSKLRKAATPSKAGSIAKKVAGAALSLVPGGGIAKVGLGIAGKLLGGSGSSAARTGARRRRKGAMYYLKRIPVEKAKARLTKIKMSAYKGL